MPLWLVVDGTSLRSVAWSDGKDGAMFVYCKETGLFHPNSNMTYSHLTMRGPYKFRALSAGDAGLEIQNGCGEHLPGHSGLVSSYWSNPVRLTVRDVMLTVAVECGRV